MKTDFKDAKVSIEKRHHGKQPAIFIVENDRVYMITTTPDGDFNITDEGIVGERYDENGDWCGEGKITPPKTPKTKPVELTNKEIMLVREALDCYGDEVADSQGYTSGEKYWNLMHKFSTDKK